LLKSNYLIVNIGHFANTIIFRLPNGSTQQKLRYIIDICSMKNMLRKSLLSVLFAGFSLLAAAQQVDTTQQRIAGRVNTPEQQQKPYVILISIDGFRYDYAQKYGAKNLLGYAQQGVKADALIPSFPSLTFPNHYTIATGLYPSHTGLVANSFYDRARKESFSMSQKDKVKDGFWYGGTPLWVLAEQQKMVSASFYWVGSDADVQGIHPSYYYYYNEQISNKDRVEVVKNWLTLPEEKRPHFISFYYPEVDHAGHDFGPESAETKAAVQLVDGYIADLVAAVNSTALPVNFILVSDHGMTQVDQKNPIKTPASIDKQKFKISSAGSMMQLYANEASDILPQYAKLKAGAVDYEVYLKKDVPKKLHYGPKDDRFNRIGDLVLLAKWPKVFADWKVNPGFHGFDPITVPDMKATFYAWGPAFKQGLQVPAFKNVEVYDVVTRILGLSKTSKTDGTGKVAQKILK
jgi:predicted AlkP superfamily pyrophosphatase or phosphodiesterase